MQFTLALYNSKLALGKYLLASNLFILFKRKNKELYPLHNNQRERDTEIALIFQYHHREMAAIAAAATALTTLHLSRKSFILPRRHFRTVITSSFSTTTEFNITFAPPKPKPQLQKPSGPESESAGSPSIELADQFYIPWIVRDEKGNLTLQTTPPERFLKALAHQTTQKKKKKDDKSTANKSKPAAPSAEPKYSKAARRFYNERFREPPQRLAKVLATAGGKYLHGFHLLHHDVV